MSRKAQLLRALAVERFKQVDKALHEIVPGLFLGSCGAAFNVDGLKENGVTHILCVATGLITQITNATKGLDLKYLEIPIEDKPGCRIVDQFPKCFQFITDAIELGGKVLVHCFQGKSRSASVIIGYLMKYKQMSYVQAVDFTKAKRSVIAPNIGFGMQLKKFERNIHSEAPGKKQIPPLEPKPTESMEKAGNAAEPGPSDSALE